MSRWFGRPRPAPDPAVRLVCLPHAGRGGAMFHSWAPLLPDVVDLCAVHLPGRESRFDETLATAMDPLVDTLLDALRPLLDDAVPVVFFGHSMGALVAFELTRRIPGTAGLVVSGCAPPHRPPTVPPLSPLDEDAFLARLRALGGTPAELFDEPEAIRLLLPILRADYRLAEDYVDELVVQPPEPVACPITVLAGTTDTETSGSELGRWSDLTTSRCLLRRIGGGHFFLESARPQVVSVVTSTLFAYLVP